MGFSAIRLQPGIDQSTLISQINENFALLENLARTQIFRDETGTNRIILGRLPDGSYGLVISKPGNDVIKLFT